MKLFPQDSNVVLYETDFEDDILERDSISRQLSDLVERIEDPIVVALDDSWGSGKTYFLKRWVTAHSAQNDGSALTVYFDAFENDYIADPLVSIVTSVGERVPPNKKATFNGLKRAAVKLAKPALRIALSLATFGAQKQLDEMGDAIADAVEDELKVVTRDLWAAEKDRKDAVVAFKKLLIELTKDGEVPLVIVVDELDRCRPDYALSVLEVIKHFFAVPKVHFILGINGKALENSVKARYGTDIDAERYLRKFISVSFSLPRAIGLQRNMSVITKYASKLVSDMAIEGEVPLRCIDLLERIAKGRDVSLRDIGKIMSKVALLPNELHEQRHPKGRINILCALLVTSVVDPDLHRKFLSGTASTSEVRDFISAPSNTTVEFFGENHNNDYDHEASIWLCEIIFCCGLENVSDIEELPHWKSSIIKQFGAHFRSDPKSIATTIQRTWVDLFKI